MSYRLENLLVLGIYMFGVVQRKLSHIYHYEKKLDSRTVSYLFVGYSERYKGFKFYCPSTKNIKTDNANFFEDIQKQWASTI